MKVLVVLMLFGSVYTVQSQNQTVQELFAAFVNDMKLELKNLQDKNKEQAAKLDKQEEQLKEQSVKLDNQVNQTEELAAKLDKQEDQQKEQAAKLDKQEDQLKGQSVKQVALQTEVGKLKKQLQGEQVAFAASLWTSGSYHFGPYNRLTPMVFKHVFTNIGNAYSTRTGRFTAPRRGAYHFDCHIYGHGVTSITAHLMKNSEPIFIAHQWDPRHAFFDSASNSVTLLLKAGDVVYMRQQSNTEVFDNYNHFTTFSGHMLFSM